MNIQIKYVIYFRSVARAGFKPRPLKLLGAGSNHTAITLRFAMFIAACFFHIYFHSSSFCSILFPLHALVEDSAIMECYDTH